MNKASPSSSSLSSPMYPLLSLLYIFFVGVQGLTTVQTDPNALAALIAGDDVNILSVSFQGDLRQFGTFSGGIASGMGLDTGILLTTGKVTDLNSNQNTSPSKQFPYCDSLSGACTNGFTPLETLVPDILTADAAVLTIQFECKTGVAEDLSFRYIFGSEEYHTEINGFYVDVFGFFLNGQTAANNVATVPDNSGNPVAVSINSINCGRKDFVNPADNTYDPTRTDNNCQLLVDNDLVDQDDPAQGSPLPAELDAWSDPLVVKGNLQSGTNTIVLAIADGSIDPGVYDSFFDSVVFIEAGSLRCREIVPTQEPTMSPAPSIAPTTAAPVQEDLVDKCYRRLLRKCYCWLYFKGSKCPFRQIKNRCDRKGFGGSLIAFRKAVMALYRPYCVQWKEDQSDTVP